MATSNGQRKDHWTSEAYNSAAGFVPKLTSTVVSYLDPKPSDNILDIGCGDGSLTAQIAQSAARVLGVDASKSFIATAKEKFTTPNCSFLLHDATDLQNCPEAIHGKWDKAFSNAAMHWILRPEARREMFFRDVNSALKKGGVFVFEQGGAGNVAEIQASSISALTHAGVPLQTARDSMPWFFPSVKWMREMLEKTGFEVEKCELEYRPSQLGEGKMEGWVRLMCAEMLECVEEGSRRDGVVREICELLETIVTRPEDGTQWLGYVRLRAVARKL